MSQSQIILPEKKSLHLDYSQSENIYSQDTFFFREMNKNEILSFLPFEDITITSVSFLFMRSLLSNAIFGNKITIADMSQTSRKRIGKLGLSLMFNQFLETNHPFLGMIEKREKPEFLKPLFEEDKSFHLQEDTKQINIQTGGGILKEKKTNAHEMAERLFTEYDLKSKNGHFFLRTKSNSYLYLLNPANKSKMFYIQQKNLFTIDFQFYHIKTYR